MLGRETHFHFEIQERPDRLLGVILRESVRPVVLVPPKPFAGHGVMVAYGGCREVARARSWSWEPTGIIHFATCSSVR
jgi:hypothetical protein